MLPRAIRQLRKVRGLHEAVAWGGGSRDQLSGGQAASGVPCHAL